jgi:hypothetical protein
LIICLPPAIEKAGFKAVRPIVEGADVIHASIIQNIVESELVLCDMSALNPNVFFEIGIRTALDKIACMVVDDVTSSVPFDTGILNYHTYKSSLEPWVLEDEVKKLSEHIRSSRGGGPRNPLWKYFGLTEKAELSKDEAGMDAKIDLVNLRLEGMARLLQSEDDRRTGNAGKVYIPFRTYRGLADSDLFNSLRKTIGLAGGALLWGYEESKDKLVINVQGALSDDVIAAIRKRASAEGVKLVIKDVGR